MPRQKQCVNQEYYECAKAILDEVDKDKNENRWCTWNRAIKSLASWPERVNSPADLIKVKHWGPKSVKDFTTVWNKRIAGGANIDPPGPSSRAPLKNTSASSRNAAPKPGGTRGKGKKRALPEAGSDLEDFSGDIYAVDHSSSPPPAKRRVVNTRGPAPIVAGGGLNLSQWDLPPDDDLMPLPNYQQPVAAPPPKPKAISTENLDGFEFIYANDSCDRFNSATGADVLLEAGKCLFLVEYLEAQQQHPWKLAYVQNTHTRQGRFFGYIDQQLGEYHHHRPDFLAAPRPPIQPRVQPIQPAAVPQDRRGSSNGGPSNSVLQRDFALNAKKKPTGSIDPSRQAPAGLQAAIQALRRKGSDAGSVAGTSQSVVNSQSSPAPAPSSSVTPTAERQVNRADIARAALARQAASRASPAISRAAGSSPAVSHRSFHDQRSSSPAVYEFSSPAPVFRKPTAAPPLARSQTAATDDVFLATRPNAALNRTASAPTGQASSSRIRRQTNHIQPPRAIDELDHELHYSQQSPLNSSPLRGEGSIADDPEYDDAGCLSSSAIFNPRDQFAPVETTFEPIIFQPNSYQIKLVLDNREKKATTQASAIVEQGLINKGVVVEYRPLHIGDAIWVAKLKPEWRNGGPDDGMPDECVLDFVVERKRMDDLVGSVKDGRYGEQKFRLKQSGIGQVFYLIEHHNTPRHREDYDQTIDTCLSSTQIVEGFKIVETKNFKDTIDWLCMMHKTIESLHRGQPLHIIPTAKIRRYSYLDLQKALRSSEDPEQPIYLTSFDDFQTLNNKAGSHTLRECFARMLLCINGMSAEKVGRLLEVYETPRELYESFVAAEEQEQLQRNQEQPAGRGRGRKKKADVIEAKHLLCTIEGTARRKIGPALSEKVYHLFRSEVYEDG